eukprot:707318-Pyramimonas_sp.AAC.1
MALVVNMLLISGSHGVAVAPPTSDESSPRAELHAFLVVVGHTTGDRFCHSDYLPLVKGPRQPRAQVASSSAMLDLWVRIWSALDDRGPGKVEVLWAKSHASAQQRVQLAIGKEEFVFLEWCADYFAGWAADMAPPSLEQ